MSKAAIKPIFPLKHDFYASLDRLLHEAGMMETAVSTLLRHTEMKPAIKELLEERLAGLRDAIRGKDEP